MDETLQAPPSAPAANQPEVEEVKEEARQAHAEGMGELAQAREKLGAPAVINGMVETPGDQAKELQYRQEHGGHASDETATKV